MATNARTQSYLDYIKNINLLLTLREYDCLKAYQASLNYSRAVHH